MVDDFLIARNPEEGSTLPYLVRIPLGDRGIVLKTKDVWPRTSKLYCHRADDWPAQPEIVAQVPTRSCSQRGAAIDLVLDRGRENRSQFVLTRARGREMIFWQSARTTKQARPNVSLPTARAQGLTDLTVLVDHRERYAWKFTHQQATTERRGLPAGDYAVEVDGRTVAAVERKSLPDLVASLTTGKLTYVLAELASLPRAAVVVEDRYSQVFALERVRPAVVAEAIAESQVRFPQVPIIFAETRALAQEWTYRFLAAAREEVGMAAGTDAALAELTPLHHLLCTKGGSPAIRGSFCPLCSSGPPVVHALLGTAARSPGRLCVEVAVLVPTTPYTRPPAAGPPLQHTTISRRGAPAAGNPKSPCTKGSPRASRGS